MRPPWPRPPPVTRMPIVRIDRGTFYRHHPHTASLHPNTPLFTHLDFSLLTDPSCHWCIVGPSLSGKTTFLEILRGQHLCFPPTARSFPFLSSGAVPPQLRIPSKAIQYVGFSKVGMSTGPTTAGYLSARYESKRDTSDFSVRDFLLGRTELNVSKSEDDSPDPALWDTVVRDLKLRELLDLPAAFLSNGQGRRARIARAVLATPEVLLLDEPFMGLDPPTVASLSPLLHTLASKASPRLVLSARPQDAIPDWITHLVYLRADRQVGFMGDKTLVLASLRLYVRDVRMGILREHKTMPARSVVPFLESQDEDGLARTNLLGEYEAQAEKRQASDHNDQSETSTKAVGEALVEMDGCQVLYGGKIGLGDWKQHVNGQEKAGLVWTVRRGERWGIFGPNGSGKTTIISLICSDHPQTYSLPIRLFGKSRLPEPGSDTLPLTIWDIQARIGQSSPEIHQLMPRSLTIRQVFENAWADTFRSKPVLDDRARRKTDAALRWFAATLNPTHVAPAISAPEAMEESELGWADRYMLGELSFSAQRVALFLRAIIKSPDIVVLDEACSGMDDRLRNRCLLFLEHGQNKTYIDGEDGSELVVESDAVKRGEVEIGGLTAAQTLICISHVREEIPDCVREWLCLPEPNSGGRARFGRSRCSLRVDEKGWKEIWEM